MKIKRVFKSNIFRNGIISSKKEILSGEYSYIILKNHLLNKKNLESGRVLIKRELKKKSKLYVRPRFLIPITKKASGIRMGKGKGPISDYICFLKMDSCLYEVTNINLPNALKILKKLSYKFKQPLALVEKSGIRYYVK
jgi:large subunit ribosomal protein L16